MKEEKIQENPELLNVRLNIFNFSANIFNKYRNCDAECDIIEQKKSFKIWGRNIPISIDKKFSVSYKTENVALSASEMTEIASEKMSESLNKRLSDATLLRIKTYGEFLENEYKMISNIVYTANIGEELPFLTE
jgi:hypothetical protein